MDSLWKRGGLWGVGPLWERGAWRVMGPGVIMGKSGYYRGGSLGHGVIMEKEAQYIIRGWH